MVKTAGGVALAIQTYLASRLKKRVELYLYHPPPPRGSVGIVTHYGLDGPGIES